MDCKEVKISELGNGRDFGENLCVATLDLGQVKKITHIEINALQDIQTLDMESKARELLCVERR